MGIQDTSDDDIIQDIQSSTTKESEPNNHTNVILEHSNPEQLWEEIGFHKPIAGFWYNIVYTIIGILMALPKFL